jgi:hypothetical protein
VVKLFGARPYFVVCAIAVSLGIVLAARMAFITAYNAHPDEFIHADAFCFFEAHAWLPPLDLNGLEYGPEGESRIYGTEVVYWFYGRSAGWLKGLKNSLFSPAATASSSAPPVLSSPPRFLPFIIGSDPLGPEQAYCALHFLTYRLFNIVLFALTLGLLFAVGARHAWAAAIGLVMLCLPQVIYLYAYANTDAWALSCALCLITFALAERHPLASLPKALLLGLLTGLVLLSKASVWVALPFAYILIAYRIVLDPGRTSGHRSRTQWLNGAAVVAAALLAIAPYRIGYPLSQGGHLAARLAQIREARALPGFKPSDPYLPGRQLRSKGVGLDQIVFNLDWVEESAKSFYGDFGYREFPAPNGAYWIALALAVLNALLTLVVLRQNWRTLPGSLRLALLLAPLVIGGSLFASMMNSWTHDYQPQGRYLLVSIVPIALWTWSTLPWDSPRTRAFRLASAGYLLAQSAYVFWQVVLQNPAFRP